jgi:hypothetical protein
MEGRVSGALVMGLVVSSGSAGRLLRWVIGNRKDISSLKFCNNCCIYTGWKTYKSWKSSRTFEFLT